MWQPKLWITTLQKKYFLLEILSPMPACILSGFSALCNTSNIKTLIGSFRIKRPAARNLKLDSRMRRLSSSVCQMCQARQDGRTLYSSSCHCSTVFMSSLFLINANRATRPFAQRRADVCEWESSSEWHVDGCIWEDVAALSDMSFDSAYFNSNI